MSIAVEAHADGLQALDKALINMAFLGEKPKPIWAAIGQYGESSTRLRFKKQAGPDGKAWKPSIRARLSGGQTLVHKARLLRSITHRANNSGAEWGTNVIYAGVQNDGAVIKPTAAKALRFRMPGGGFVSLKKVTIPARTFMGVNADDGREMLALAHDAVDLVARNRGAI